MVVGQDALFHLTEIHGRHRLVELAAGIETVFHLVVTTVVTDERGRFVHEQLPFLVAVVDSECPSIAAR